MVNLANQRVPVDGICLSCGKFFDTTLHALWDCKDVKYVRQSLSFLRAGISVADSSPVVWKAPAEGIVKVNSDTTLDMNRCVVGFGLVIRDFMGMLLATSAQYVPASFSPLIAEAMAVCEFVPRIANSVAHSFAKLSLSLSEDGFWINGYHPCVERLILADVSA
ncbi:hypothetical protein Dsin_028729 [Dipteronia sinensis]|uniref:RNase H type-1 domain-containing protein n=1 Tax=Dipteronia sinensis TaxID=43782 RepID=A0AAD9ZR97_9ROSI|nr:hypothetical protein Dsin_028729 [Dipteronia sinensis]